MEYTGQNQSRQKETSSNPQVSALIHRPAFNGMERIYQRNGSNQTLILLFWTENHYAINLYITISGVEEFFVSITSLSVIMLSLQ